MKAIVVSLIRGIVTGLLLCLPLAAGAAQTSVTWTDDPNFSLEAGDYYEIQRKLVPTPVPVTGPVRCGDTPEPPYLMLVTTRMHGAATYQSSDAPGFSTYLDSTVEQGAAYCYRVRLIRGDGENKSAWSNERGRYVPIVPAPTLSVGP
jgi:hypothetical protein